MRSIEQLRADAIKQLEEKIAELFKKDNRLQMLINNEPPWHSEMIGASSKSLQRTVDMIKRTGGWDYLAVTVTAGISSEIAMKYFDYRIKLERYKEGEDVRKILCDIVSEEKE